METNFKHGDQVTVTWENGGEEAALMDSPIPDDKWENHLASANYVVKLGVIGKRVWFSKDKVKKI